MPTSPILTYQLQRVDPFIDPEDAAEIPVNLVASTTYPAGTILGEVIGLDETVTITIDATGGTFTITFGAQTTTALAWNAPAADVQAALELLSSIGSGNILVTKAGLVYTLVFRGTLGQTNVGNVTTTPGALTGGAGTAAVAVVTQGAVGTPGTYAPYLAGNSNGSQNPKGILRYACVTDASGNIAFGSQTPEEWGQTHKAADMWISGNFRCEDLVGLDAAAVTALGRIVFGTRTHGVIALYGA